jgi:4'-phosphopantetheinyl transferase
MVIPLELTRNGAPVPGFLGLSCGADYERWRPRAETVLGPSELAYFQGLQYARRQSSYLLGRLAVKRALSELLKEPRLEQLEIVPGVFRQPILVCPAPARPEISLAHAQGVAVGVACQPGHPVGVDLELLEAERQAIFPQVFQRDELAMFTAFGMEESSAGFRLWTIKEALSKVLRCGLTAPFEILRPKAIQPPAPGFPAQSYEVQFEHFSQYKAHSWILGGYALALVIPRNTRLGWVAVDGLGQYLEAAKRFQSRA